MSQRLGNVNGYQKLELRIESREKLSGAGGSRHRCSTNPHDTMLARDSPLTLRKANWSLFQQKTGVHADRQNSARQ